MITFFVFSLGFLTGSIMVACWALSDIRKLTNQTVKRIQNLTRKQ